MRAFVSSGEIAGCGLEGLETVPAVEAATRSGGWAYREVCHGRERRREWYWPTLPGAVQGALVRVYAAAERRGTGGRTR